MTRTRFAVALAVALFVGDPRLGAAPAPAVTLADYQRAESFLGYRTAPLVLNAGVRPTWLPDGRFWYRTQRAEGPEFVLVDPARRTKAPAFDHARVLQALSTAAGRTYERTRLPFQTIEFADDGAKVVFTVGQRRYTCDVAGSACTSVERPAPRPEVLSPDGARAAFIRDWNLWVRDVATGQETALTTDGVKDYGYATDNAGWRSATGRSVKWSPDSKKIATFQQDQRKTSARCTWWTPGSGHPRLEAWKYPLPGDKVVTMIERVVIDVETRQLVRFKMPPDQHRSTLCDDVICGGGDWVDVQWAPDSSSLAFVSSSRDHKLAELKVADIQTGVVREVMNELVGTFFESGNGAVNWRYLPASNEFIWFSQRSNWGHLYLYNLTTGQQTRQLTSGDWNVTRTAARRHRGAAAVFRGRGPRRRARSVLPPSLPRRFRRSGAPAADAGRRRPRHLARPGRRRAGGRRLGTRYRPDRGAARPRGRRTARAGDRRHLAAGRLRLAAADAHHGEGARRRHRPARPAVSPDALRCRAQVPDHQQHLPGTADRQRRLAELRGVARRHPGAGRARLRRRADRRHGHALALQAFHEAYYGDMGDNTCPTRWRA
jgi:hypothetical protein